MTSNQIKYWDLEEKKRSNKANEIETNRANVARERELNRSNVARETETNRHNLATELQQQRELAEQSRHNVTVETEANRSNVANEYLKHETNLISDKVGMANVGLGYSQLSELVHHNRNQERLNYYDTVTRQQVAEETKRNNLAQEQQRINEWAMQGSTLSEQGRHNQTVEQETERANREKAQVTREENATKVTSGLLNQLQQQMYMQGGQFNGQTTFQIPATGY